MRLFGKDKITFSSLVTKENVNIDDNPSKGWYEIHPFDVSREPDWSKIQWTINPRHRLIMLQLDIHSYANDIIPDDALKRIRDLLEYYTSTDKEIILRVLYDREGKGMENEPSFLSTVKTHMEQIGCIVKEYSQAIYVVQGLFVGNFGEMHGSKFLTKDKMKVLVKTWQDATENTCRLALRTPSQLRQIVSKESFLDKDFNICLYNDGIMASDTDFGTYGESSSKIMWEASWNRNEELEFQDELCKYVPNGGEVINDNPFNDFEKAKDTLKKMHVSYLNSQYDKAVLDKWDLEYITAHLGYKFVVRDAVYDKKEKCLKVQVENTGFSNIYDKTSVWLREIVDGKITKEENLRIDATQFDAGKTVSISIHMDLNFTNEKEIYLRMCRNKDGKVIKFSNENADDACLIGRLSKT